MGFKCGIVGLPNVGKSTIFNALTSAKAEAANYPFCTIEPNTGVVKVPDPRLDKITEYVKPKQTIPAIMTFVDIAGLVKGASKGEGLGNQFLAHIRETEAIVHVVRCFEDGDITHVDGTVNPVRDVEVIDTELCLADLDSATRRFDQIKKAASSGQKDALKLMGVLQPVKECLEAGRPIRSLPRFDKEQQEILRSLFFITAKKVMYVANVAESDLANPDVNPHVQALKAHAAKEGAEVVTVCGKVEAELAELSPEERLDFLKEMGLNEAGLNRVIRTGYKLLGLQTYFTAGEKEVRAWTIHQGWTAPQAAGVIHSDFEKGFIKAEVYHYDDLLKYKTEVGIKEAGAMRLEGKEYVVKDGDIMLFRFNV